MKAISLFGVILTLVSGAVLVDLALADVLGLAPPLAELLGPWFGPSVDYTALSAGILGAALVGWGTTLAGLRLPRSVRAHAAALGLGLWFVLDGAISVTAGAWPNVAGNMVFLFTLGVWILRRPKAPSGLERSLHGIDLAPFGPLLQVHARVVPHAPEVACRLTLDDHRLVQLAPFLRKVTYDGAVDRDVTRECQVTFGAKLTERFVAYRDGQMYAYQAVGLGVFERHLSVWSFESHPEGAKVTVHFFGDAVGPWALPKFLVFGAIMRIALGRLARAQPAPARLSTQVPV